MDIETYLQEEYKKYVEEYKKNYYDVSYMNFDEWYRMHEEYWYLMVCANCGEIVPSDYGKQTEHDGFICEQCLNDGYGK
jgi:formylmethanofuran dehydrogenase subunit E